MFDVAHMSFISLTQNFIATEDFIEIFILLCKLIYF